MYYRLANFQGAKSEITQKKEANGSNLNNYVQSLFDASIEWKDINWLKSITNLPIIVKGIMTAEDAKIAVAMGVQGILVSNHGARQIDGTPASVSF